MAIVRALSAAVISLITSTSTILAGFVDPRLEAWNSKSANIMTEQRKVIVFLNSPAYVDRSGLLRVQAIAAEQNDMKKFVTSEATRLTQKSAMPLRAGASAEVLWASRAFVTDATRADVMRLSKDASVEAVIENAIITLEKPLTASGKNETNEDEYT